MKISLKAADSYEFVANLFQYYIYDVSEFMGWPPNENGCFVIDDSVTGLSDYWNKSDHFPYLIFADGEVAGFSLVRKFPDTVDEFDMGQFFILRKFKRKGVGQKAFMLTVQKHQGDWLTRVLPDNISAKKFWEKVVYKVACGKVEISSELYKNRQMNFIRYSVVANKSNQRICS